MVNQEREYKNENLSILVKRDPNCLVTFDISVSPQATISAYAKAMKNVSKEVSVPGFRKGKAPEAMLVKQYSKQIDREFRDLVINTSFHEAVQLAQAFPFREKESVKRVDLQKCSKEEGAKIIISFESFPEVPSINASDLQVQKFEPSLVKDSDVNEELEQLAYRQATWEDVTGRAVQEGDFIDIDITILDEGAEKNVCEDSRFLVAKGKMGDWMRRLVIGLNVGDSTEGMSEKEENSPEDFKPSLCRIVIKGIKVAKLPEMSDDFAVKLGATSFEDLKEKVHKSLLTRADEESRTKSRKSIHEEILEKYPFELPASLLEAERNSRLKGKMHWLKHQKLSSEENNRLQKELHEEATQEAEKAIRTQYLIYKVIQDQKIEVSQEELLQELVKQMMLPEEQRSISDKDDIEATRSELRRMILFRKAFDFLASHALKKG